MNQTIQDTTAAFRATADTFVGAGRDLFYAGLGLLAMIEEETRDGFDALVREGRRVERGDARTLTAKAVEAVEDEARELEEEVGEVRRAADEIGTDIETRIVETIGTVLHRMNVPTRDDVESLTRSVDRLNKKAIALRAA